MAGRGKPAALELTMSEYDTAFFNDGSPRHGDYGHVCWEGCAIYQPVIAQYTGSHWRSRCSYICHRCWRQCTRSRPHPGCCYCSRWHGLLHWLRVPRGVTHG
jgi:hypothetical protein